MFASRDARERRRASWYGDTATVLWCSANFSEGEDDEQGEQLSSTPEPATSRPDRVHASLLRMRLTLLAAYHVRYLIA